MTTQSNVVIPTLQATLLAGAPFEDLIHYGLYVVDRYKSDAQTSVFHLLPVGGATVYVNWHTYEEKKERYIGALGIALCSVDDLFCKRTGRHKAMGLSKSNRRSIEILMNVEDGIPLFDARIEHIHDTSTCVMQTLAGGCIDKWVKNMESNIRSLWQWGIPSAKEPLSVLCAGRHETIDIWDEHSHILLASW